MIQKGPIIGHWLCLSEKRQRAQARLDSNTEGVVIEDQALRHPSRVAVSMKEEKKIQVSVMHWPSSIVHWAWCLKFRPLQKLRFRQLI